MLTRRARDILHLHGPGRTQDGEVSIAHVHMTGAPPRRLVGREIERIGYGEAPRTRTPGLNDARRTRPCIVLVTVSDDADVQSGRVGASEDTVDEEWPVFEEGYEAPKRATGAFRTVTPNTLASAVYDKPISLIGLSGILGFTPPEWAHFAALHTEVEITQKAARSLDRSPKELRGCRP